MRKIKGTDLEKERQEEENSEQAQLSKKVTTLEAEKAALEQKVVLQDQQLGQMNADLQAFMDYYFANTP